MECQKCHEPIEEGAAFCGNCGQALTTIPLRAATVPAYAIATPAKRVGEVKALLSVLLGVAGLAGAVFVALFGIVLGTAGIAMGTMSRRSPRRSLSTVGLVISGLAVLFGLAVWVYNVNHEQKNNTIAPATTQGPVTISLASEVTTPCYSASFAESLRVSQSANSCDTQIYNGATFEQSSEIYKIYSQQSRVRTEDGFNTLAKKAIEADFATNLKTFTIQQQQSTTFAGSPAYTVTAVDEANNIAVIEAAIMHQTSSGNNIFIIVHGNNGTQSNLQTLEAQWIWK